jgi:hypothetical protein
VIGRADGHARARDVCRTPSEGRAIRKEDREMEQAERAPSRGPRRARTFVQPDERPRVMRAERSDARRAILYVEPEDGSVVRERAIEIAHLQVDGANVRAVG